MPQQDPLNSITEALKLELQDLGLKNVIQGFPDNKFFTVDGRLPSLFVYQVSDNAKHLNSTETTHAIVNNPDGITATVYKEQMRLTYLLQLSLFTNSKEERSNIGWAIQNRLATKRQLQMGITGVETALFNYKSQHNPMGETNFYQRDMTFEVKARILSEEKAYRLSLLKLNNNS